MSSQPFISVAVLALFSPPSFLFFFNLYLSLDDSSYPQLPPPYAGDDHKCPLTQATSWGERKDKEDLENSRSPRPELNPIHLNTARNKHFHPYAEAG